ncbi:hypothetical protein CNR22_11860 [Sphingobacteriaceae bacterium]|nr:hypothetical protein CNR22_11860 [Sphingobacteriaceae bacterium]
MTLFKKNGTITGTLKDDKGITISSAGILLQKDSAGRTITVQTSVTNANGEFSFLNVPVGKYKVLANSKGYNSTLMTNIIVRDAATTHIDMSIKISSSKTPKVEIVNYKEPLAEKDAEGPASPKKEEFKNTSRQDIKTIVAAPTAAYESEYAATPLTNSYSPDREFNTEEYSKITDNEFKDAQKDPLSTFSIDVDKASYSNMRRFITSGQLPPADAVRVEELINYFPYSYPQPKGPDPFSITTQYLECPWNSNHNLIHIGIQGKELKMDKAAPSNLVFLLDVSGSMEDANKLPLLKSGLKLLIDQMRAEDKVSIVVYAGAAGVVLPPTSGNHKERITDALDKLSAGGSTAGGEGIILAYKLAKESFIANGNNRVILATDGDFNVGASSDGELIRLIEKQRESGVFLTVLGFGSGNYKDSKMEQLADKGNGNYAYIDNLLEAKKVMVKEMGGTLFTIAKDVKIQIEFNPSKVKAYRLVGYENRMLNKEDFNDDKKDAGELGAGHNVTAIYEIIPAGSKELLASVDSLKYQRTIPVVKSTSTDVMTIKFRYKEPAGTTSKLITEVLEDKKTAFVSASEDCRFALAVAEFGMVLRDSQFKGDADYKSILKMAKSSKGKDDDGYRAEFIRLVEMAELLKR